MRIQTPMLHLAERNLLFKIFQERVKMYYENERKEQEPCEIELALFGYWQKRQETRPVLEMTMQRNRKPEGLATPIPMQLWRKYQIDLHEGYLSLRIEAWREMGLTEAEIAFLKSLVVDMAEALKLFANGDLFMKLGVEKLVAEIADETELEDPTAWVREYLSPPPFMERSEVRRYYRLYNNHLNHAHPQILLARRKEDLIETPV